MKLLKSAVVAVALSLLISVSFAQKKAGAKKGDVAKGKDIFESKCEICHNADSTDKKIGPGLKGAKSGKLPSGKNATHDEILAVIDAGGGGMPAFKDLLSDEEKEDVIAYVLTL